MVPWDAGSLGALKGCWRDRKSEAVDSVVSRTRVGSTSAQHASELGSSDTDNKHTMNAMFKAAQDAATVSTSSSGKKAVAALKDVLGFDSDDEWCLPVVAPRLSPTSVGVYAVRCCGRCCSRWR